MAKAPIRLADLRPRLVGTLAHGVLIFDCPSGRPHRVRICIRSGRPHGLHDCDIYGYERAAWRVVDGEFPDSLTLHPDILHDGWHGYIRDGAAVTA